MVFVEMIYAFSVFCLNFAVQHSKSDDWMPEEAGDRRRPEAVSSAPLLVVRFISVFFVMCRQLDLQVR